MSRNLITRKKTIIINHLDNRALDVQLADAHRPIPASADPTRKVLRRETCEIRLSQFANEGEDRASYSARLCTDKAHGPGGCDGICHEPKCSKPADFFEHWRAEDGRECCVPLCKSHIRNMNSLQRRAVLWALNDGVVDYLCFMTDLDPLPNGLPRCGSGYYQGDAEVRCTFPATKRVRVTEKSGKGEEISEAKLCTRCATAQVRDGLQIEILGDLDIPTVKAREK
jgi:hypothetical protein